MPRCLHLELAKGFQLHVAISIKFHSWKGSVRIERL